MKPSVAIIGSGISGIVASYLLDNHYQVTLIEANERLGGHTNTVFLNDDVLGTVGIDTGFIVFNLKNYPLFTTFLDRLKVSYQDSDMSFGFWNQYNNFCYSSDFPWGASYKNLFSLKFWCFLQEIRRFNHCVVEDLKKDDITMTRLENYLLERGFSSFFQHAYVLPMGAAIWSCSTDCILNFPAKSFFLFWKNHSLLALGKRPVWKTICKGSQSYIERFLEKFGGIVLKSSPVIQVTSHHNYVDVTLKNHQTKRYDYVVIATHADQALNLLENPTNDQKNLLGSWRYSNNEVCLHTDTRVMPKNRRSWASWLVKNHGNSRLVMTYYMNRLQTLNTSKHYFVTLNYLDTIDKDCVLKVIDYTHPIYDQKSLESQEKLHNLNRSPLFFCGSYFGNGFHEDGVRSAVEACKHLGVSW